jgi:hypothetical protein
MGPKAWRESVEIFIHADPQTLPHAGLNDVQAMLRRNLSGEHRRHRFGVLNLRSIKSRT